MTHTLISHAMTVTAAEQVFFLSEILGAHVLGHGKQIGKLKDVIIKENGAMPIVTHLYFSRPFGESAVVPWEMVQTIHRKEVLLEVPDLAALTHEPEEGAVLLKDYILDKKAIDLEGRELEVVYDVKLALRNGKLYVTDVDLSRYGLLRRLGLARLANLIYEFGESIRDQTISWKYIQPLPETIGRFRGDVRLNILKDRLEDMHPVDLADILEEMDPDQRVKIFEKLDPEQASDTLEEIEPNTQRDLVESLKIEKVAQLVDQMTTGQAADVLSVLSAPEAEAIVRLIDPQNAQKIRAIMEHHEENILDFSTKEYIAFPPDMSVEEAQAEYRVAARGKDIVMYIYVVDASGVLLGVLDIKELLQAEDATLLKDAMIDHYISLDPDSTLKEASEMFARYNLRAIPITDDKNKMLGAVTYRDIVGLKHRYVE